MKRCVFSAGAQADLAGIQDFIAASSPHTAARFVERIEALCRSIADAPDMGRPRDELVSGLPSVPIGSYVVFYRTLGDAIQIVRVVHGYRNLWALFRRQ
jgi:toxin ParE1/3/4